MSGHTKGPWLIDEVEADLVEITSDSRTGKVEIASVQLGYDAPIGDEQRANARLIAAAPDLKTFAVALDNFWTSEFPGGPDAPIDANGHIRLSDATVTLWRQCRDAIAKAEGRS